MRAAKLVRDFAVYGLGEVLNRAFNMATILILTRLLTPAEYGLLALTVPAVAILTALIGFGSEVTYGRFFFDSDDRAAQATITATWLVGLGAIGCLGVGVVWLFQSPIAAFVLDGTLVSQQIVLIAAIAAPISIANLTCSQALRNRFMARSFVLLNLLSISANFALLVLLVVWLRAGVRGAVAATLFSALLLLPIRLSTIRDLLFARVSFSKLREMLGYGASVTASSLSSIVVVFVDRWLIGRMMSVADVGRYAVAASLVGLLAVFLAAFGQSWMPHFYQTLQSSPAEARRLASRVLTLSIATFGLLAVSVASFARIALDILVGEQFTSASIVVGPLAVALLISTSIQVTSLGPTIAKKPGLLFFCLSTSAVIGVAATVVGIRLAGIVGAAWAAALTQFCLTSACLFFTQRLWPVPIEYGRVLPIFAVAIGCVVIAGLRLANGLAAEIALGALLIAGFAIAAMWISDLGPARIMRLARGEAL